MTVSELIRFLQTQPQDLPVAYRCCSEHELLTAGEIKIKCLSVARPDGWIHDARSDKATIRYLVLPGN